MTSKGACILMLFLLMGASWTGAMKPTPFHEPDASVLEHAAFQGFTVSNETAPWNTSTAWGAARPAGFSYMDTVDYSDVGVVINNLSEASRTIGWAFVAARNIPLERVFLFNESGTPTGETINRNQFNTYFAEPFLEMLQNRTSASGINFLVTTKGVPLRVSGGNDKASFDQEFALLGGSYNSSIGNNGWFNHGYGPLAGQAMEPFSRSKYGFFLVTRLTGYTVDTALELIERANQSLGARGDFVLDVATNRNGSGYKFWNDALYDANTTLNGTMGLPVVLDEETLFLTGLDDVMGYASWGSNDGNWNANRLPNAGFDTANTGWSSGARYWNATAPSVSGGDTATWLHQGEVKRNGNFAMGLELSTTCDQDAGGNLNGVYAEYFDNNGVSITNSPMPDLTERTPDHVRIEADVNRGSSNSAYPGLDDRFKQHWGARFTGFIDVPTAGNWSFFLNSDDGSELWINGVSLVENHGMHGMRERSGWVNLTAGLHDFRIEFYQGGGPHGLIFSWSGPNTTKAPVPASAFVVAGGHLPQPDRMMHEWTFEDGTGASAADTAGTADLTMSSGMGNSNWATCVDGGCLSFDGSDDVVSAEVDDWTGPFTVSQWVKANTSNQTSYASTFAVDNNAGSNGSFQHMVSSGTWRFHTNQSHTFGAVEAQRWTHLASTHENGTLKLYVDGVLVNNVSLPPNQTLTVDRIKLGVNRAGSAFYHGFIDNVRVWNTTLTPHDIGVLRREIVDNCSSFSGHGNDVAELSSVYDFSTADQNLTDHAWILYAHGQRTGDVFGSFSLRIQSLDAAGNVLNTNASGEEAFGPSWTAETVRFRPDANAVAFRVSILLDIVPTSTDGTLFLDTLSLRPIRPHMSWVNGSIGDTAVSTGGRSFNWGTGYGQSLVADLLEDGISGVKGYVYEPYLTAVGRPDVLLPTYASGYNLAESHAAANLLSGWMGVVVGDPKMSAYADIYHDVALLDVHVPQPVHLGVPTTVHVLLENRGMSAANGNLRLETLVGSQTLNTTNLSLPAGDALGSRTVVNLTVVLPSSGLLDLRLRYTNSTPERAFSNNLLTFQTSVNEPPSVDTVLCRANSITRGTYTICSVEAEDDGNVTNVTLAWQIINGTLENLTEEWNLLPLGQINERTWESALVIPANASLGTLVIRAVVEDDLGLIVQSNPTASSAIVDSPARWFGPHVSDVDDPSWTGTTTLAPQPTTPVPRHLSQRVRACVQDEDRRPGDAWPVFLPNRGNVTNITESTSVSTNAVCYETTWLLGAGSSLDAARMEVRTLQGSLLLQRTFAVLDVAPTLTLHAEHLNGERLDRLVNNGEEHLVVTVSDIDDPRPTFVGDAYVQWPGGTPSQTPVDIAANASTVRWRMEQIPGGLEAGEVSVRVTGRGPNGAVTEVDMSLPFLLTPPEVDAARACDGNGVLESMTFGDVGTLAVAIVSDRPVDRVTAQLVQDGWAVVAPEAEAPVWDEGAAPLGCEMPTSLNGSEVDWHLFRLRLDPSFLDGEGAVLVNVRDVDGLSRSFTLDLMFQHAPTLLEPLNISEAIPETDLHMTLGVSDEDGLSNVICSLAVMDSNGTQLMQSSQAAGEATQFSTLMGWMYPLPRTLANQTLAVNVTCVDELMQTVTQSSQVTVGPAGPCTSCNTTTATDAAETDGAKSGPGMQPTLVLGVAALIATVALIGARFARNRHGVREEKSDAWAASSSVDFDTLFDAPTMVQDNVISEQRASSPRPEIIPQGWTGQQFLAWLDGPMPEGWAMEQWKGYIETHRDQVQHWLTEQER